MLNQSAASRLPENSLSPSAHRDPAPSVWNLAAMLLLAAMWGLSIPVTKLGLLTLPPLTLTALRFAIAVPLLLLFIVGRQRLPWGALPRVAALGVLGIGVGQVAQTFGVAGTSASVGTIISATIPVFVVFFAASVQYLQPVVGIAASSAMFGDAMGALFAAGVILVLGGLALTVTSRGKAA